MEHAVVESDHGLFVLSCVDGEPLELLGTPGAAAALISAQPSAGYLGSQIYVQAGVWMGPVDVTAEFYASPPPFDAAQWDDIVEFSCAAATSLAITEFMGEQVFDLPEAVGALRIRLCARGREASAARYIEGPPLDDDGEPVFDESPVEFFSLQVWQAPSQETTVVKLDSLSSPDLARRESQ